MRNMLLVARREFSIHARNRWFLFATFGLPVLIVVIFLAVRTFTSTETPDVQQISQSLTEADLPETGIVGFVDESGLVQTIPPLLEERVRAYDSRADAEADLRAGETDSYYIIARDYLEEGNVERVARVFQPDAEDRPIIEYLLTANLLEGADPARLALIRNPVLEQGIETENIGERAADRAGGEDAGGLAFGLAYAAAMLIYTTTFTSASYLLQSVGTEKENRVMEVLLTSIRPFQLLAGKVLGLGVLGLLQTAIWVGFAFAISRVGLFELSADSLGLNGGLVAMMLLYFVLGYGVYSAMMAGIGALVPSVKESGPATFLVVIPAIIPLMVLGQLVEQPHSPLAVALSLIPFTAPITMIVRVVQGGVPAWQIVASVAIMAVSVPLLLGLVARLFRAQTLLSSEPFSPRRAWAALREG